MKRFLTAAMVLVVGISLAACGGQTPASPETSAYKVAMVTDTGGVQDGSFNQSAWEGLQSAQSEFGYVSTFLESSQEADYGPNIDKLVDQGNNLIWGVGFMMANSIQTAAEANPDQAFALVDNDNMGIENVLGVVFRAQEPSFLVGYMAARTSQTKVIGFVGGMEGDVISQFDYGYQAGAMYAAKEGDFEIEILRQYANSFTDDAAGKSIANIFYGNGADIVFHAAGNVGKGVAAAAVENNKLFIGVDKDQSELAPDHTLTSALKLVGQAMKVATKELAEGKELLGTNLALGISDGAAGIPDNDATKKLCDPAVYQDTLKIQELILKGDIVPPYNEETYNAYIEEINGAQL